MFLILPHCRHSVQQRFPIIMCIAAPYFGKDSLVTGKFARPGNLPAHKMYHRMKPMQADHSLHQPFVKQIPPFIVRQFMQQYILNILIRNICTWQHDTRMEKAYQQWRRNQRIDT